MLMRLVWDFYCAIDGTDGSIGHYRRSTGY